MTFDLKFQLSSLLSLKEFSTLKTSCYTTQNVDWTPHKQPHCYGNLHIVRWTVTAPYSCCFRIGRRRFCGTGFSISTSGFRNVWEYNVLCTVRACTASWDSEHTEGWNQAGAEQTQRTADIWWHTGDDLLGHGCVRWGYWSILHSNFWICDAKICMSTCVLICFIASGGRLYSHLYRVELRLAVWNRITSSSTFSVPIFQFVSNVNSQATPIKCR